MKNFKIYYGLVYGYVNWLSYQLLHLLLLKFIIFLVSISNSLYGTYVNRLVDKTQVKIPRKPETYKESEIRLS